MAKKATTSRRRKITLIQTDKAPREVAAMLGRKKPVTVSLFVHTPETGKTKAASIPTARLCRCRRVCVALV
jgi:hypothetical protein